MVLHFQPLKDIKVLSMTHKNSRIGRQVNEYMHVQIEKKLKVALQLKYINGPSIKPKLCFFALHWLALRSIAGNVTDQCWLNVWCFSCPDLLYFTICSAFHCVWAGFPAPVAFFPLPPPPPHPNPFFAPFPNLPFMSIGSGVEATLLTFYCLWLFFFYIIGHSETQAGLGGMWTRCLHYASPWLP